MNVAFVKKLAASKTRIVLEDLLGKRQHYKSNFILIEEEEKSVFSNYSHELIKFLKTNHDNVVIETVHAKSLVEKHIELKFKVEGGSDTVILVKDLALELLDKATMAVLIRNLYALSKRNPIIVPLLTSILEPVHIAALEYIAETVIKVLPLHNDDVFPLSVVHRIPGGKLVTETVIFSKGQFHLNKNTTISDRPSASTVPVSTFNLGLTAEQAAIKASIELPHLRAQVQDLSIGSIDGKSYRNILAEDYDEEDPDDDLDL